MIKDLSFGEDWRGECIFIDIKHIDGWEIDEETKAAVPFNEVTSFRVIEDGEMQSGHGEIEKGKIVQWG